MPFETPILLICFQRTKNLETILAKIQKIRPTKMFICCDGAKNIFQKSRVRETRKLVTQYFPRARRLFQFKNKGCGLNVASAISWFFTHNSEGIILEDDVMPSADFFIFAKKALEKHRDDPSVASVTGFCPWPNSLAPNVPFLRSKYFSMWGWGTWARVWKNYILDPEDENKLEWSKAIRRACDSDNENEFWQNILQKLRNKDIDTWDYQFFFQALANNQVHIRPSKSLVQNLGFGADATHTGVEPRFVRDQKTPLSQDQPHWFLDDVYFYFRHLAFLDDGIFSFELASKRLLNLSEENKKLKLLLQGGKRNQPIRRLFRKLFYRQ
jgi:hypothetical protein